MEKRHSRELQSKPGNRGNAHNRIRQRDDVGTEYDIIVGRCGKTIEHARRNEKRKEKKKKENVLRRKGQSVPLPRMRMVIGREMALVRDLGPAGRGALERVSKLDPEAEGDSGLAALDARVGNARHFGRGASSMALWHLEVGTMASFKLNIRSICT